MFEIEIMPAHQVLDRALSLVMEYGIFDIACSTVNALTF